MTNFDIIGVLRTYATAKGWVFLSGENSYKNYELTQASLTKGKIVFAAECKSDVEQKNKTIIKIKYTCSLMLGEKTEATGIAVSSMDETYIQKYDARLLALTTLLATTIGDIACTNQLDISNYTMEENLNTFNENLDFIVTTVTLTQG